MWIPCTSKKLTIFVQFFMVKRIAEQNGGKYEMAVYAAQCCNLKRVLPICSDWEVTNSMSLKQCFLVVF